MSIRTQRDIANMTVAITGGARGIGRATAERLARQGAKVIIGDRDQDLVRQTAAEIGHGVVAAGLDVTSAESWNSFLEETAAAGPIDVLVNNAGIMPPGSVLKESEELPRSNVAGNLHGINHGTKANGRASGRERMCTD